MKIVYFGDSITNGFLELDRHSNVVNLGVSGDRIDNLINRLDNVYKHNPDRLIVMIGTNDYLCKRNYWGDPLDYDIIEYYHRLLNSLSTNLPNTEIIILPILPVSMNIDKHVMEEYNKDIHILNMEIKSICDSKNIHFHDIYPHFLCHNKLNREYTTDGVHLNTKGYQLYYQLILRFLSES